MRLSLMLCLLLPLTGCAQLWLRHDPSMAWLDLAPAQGQRLGIAQVDGHDLGDADYVQLSPEHHELQVRLHFEVAADNVGTPGQPLPRTCLLNLQYAGFAAGQRYRLETGSHGFRPWAKLRDQHGYTLATAREGRCGDV
ncbi:hypothetical protein ACF8C6_17585 [Pseudomonas sp. zbq_18]|uniref:PA0061/PA0062 family lipoprotein n=1 Tax=Pseudomonadota TaxID=1224 RepID=UPI00370AE727